MFQVASTIGIASSNKMRWGFPEWVNYDAKERFNTDEDIEVGKWFKPLPKQQEVTYEKRFIHWGFQVVKLDRDKHYDLEGHLQSERYFKHCESTIRELFTMEGEPTDDVAIHVRMGDYASSGGYHPVCSKDYYDAAVKKMGRDRNYVVFSDEPDKAQEMFPDWEVDRGGTKEALRRMMWCRDFIIANSTFSWWGAWLGWSRDKKVIAPKKWFGEQVSLSAKDIYNDSMILI